MQFVLYKYEGSISNDEKQKIRDAFEGTSSVICKHNNYEWSSKPNNVFFLAKNPDLEIYQKYKVFNVNENNDLSFIHGWVKKDNEDYLLPADNIDSIIESRLDGFYVVGDIDGRGNGEFYCSAISPQLYYAKSENAFAISNRISLLSKIFDYDTPNKKHLSSHIQYQHGPLTFDTMYENIFWIPFGTKIKIQGYELLFEKIHDFFYDERLDKLYSEDKSKYWDEFYEKMSSQVNAFINLGIKDKLTLGLSGGVDSRLILSMYHEHLSTVFTNGPSYSPEVIVGRMVADTLNIAHSTPNIRAVSSSFNLLKRIPEHLFAREFEMCPWDFGWTQKTTKENIKLDGQEFIRVAPYVGEVSIDSILEEENLKYSKIQNMGAISDEFIPLIVKENNDICEEYLSNMHDIHKFPTLRKVFNRGRWATRVHETIFDHSFHIYPLLTNIFIKYSYNSSIESINNQDIAFEVIKRSCPELLDVPLFGKQFSQKPIPAIENKIPGKLNYKNIYLVRYFDFIKKFILDNYTFIECIVNKEFIVNLNASKVENNAKLSQIIYNILQAIILYKYSDFALLNNELDIDFEFEEEKFEDTYDQDCVSAFVQYNQDIVDLKIDNISLSTENEILNNEINKLTKQLEDYMNSRNADNSLLDSFESGSLFFKLDILSYSLYLMSIQGLSISLFNNVMKLNSVNDISKLSFKLPYLEKNSSYVVKIELSTITDFNLKIFIGNNNIYNGVIKGNLDEVIYSEFYGCEGIHELILYFEKLDECLFKSIEIKKIKS